MPWIEWSPPRPAIGCGGVHSARWTPFLRRRRVAVVRSVRFAGAVVRTRCGAVVRSVRAPAGAVVRGAARRALLMVRFASYSAPRCGVRSRHGRAGRSQVPLSQAPLTAITSKSQMRTMRGPSYAADHMTGVRGRVARWPPHPGRAGGTHRCAGLSSPVRARRPVRAPRCGGRGCATSWARAPVRSMPFIITARCAPRNGCAHRMPRCPAPPTGRVRRSGVHPMSRWSPLPPGALRGGLHPHRVDPHSGLRSPGVTSSIAPTECVVGSTVSTHQK